MRMTKGMKNIVVIDDDLVFCSSVHDYLSSKTMTVFTAQSAAEGLKLCTQHKVDVVLLDQKLPDGEGVALCPSILQQHEQAKIIFITAYPSFDNAVKAIKMGAYDYLSKPFELDELGLAVERAIRTLELERIEQVQSYQQDKESEESILVWGQGRLAEVIKVVEVAASADAPVLITGETGTGKSAIAKYVHYKSSSHKRAFLCINCAAFPENLIEVELFGCERGAYTGAVAARKGIFELAEGGTLFLDEIAAMPMHLQSKLLGVLEEKQIRRIGGESVKKVDVRIIAASNANVEEAIAAKTFREDLYYRLSVIRIHIPPLRERREDIAELCAYFIQTMANGREAYIPDAELLKLTEYGWPGNVRELKNIIERTLLIQKGPLLRPSEFLGGQLRPSSAFPPPDRNGVVSLEDVEKRHIRHMLDSYSGNYSRAARALGISLSTLKRKVKSYGLIPMETHRLS
jgi:DNA-binding NtrC family response regulator